MLVLAATTYGPQQCAAQQHHQNAYAAVPWVDIEELAVPFGQIDMEEDAVDTTPEASLALLAPVLCPFFACMHFAVCCWPPCSGSMLFTFILWLHQNDHA